jgi:hypothetical protein
MHDGVVLDLFECAVKGGNVVAADKLRATHANLIEGSAMGRNTRASISGVVTRRIFQQVIMPYTLTRTDEFREGKWYERPLSGATMNTDRYNNNHHVHGRIHEFVFKPTVGTVVPKTKFKTGHQGQWALSTVTDDHVVMYRLKGGAPHLPPTYGLPHGGSVECGSCKMTPSERRERARMVHHHHHGGDKMCSVRRHGMCRRLRASNPTELYCIRYDADVSGGAVLTRDEWDNVSDNIGPTFCRSNKMRPRTPTLLKCYRNITVAYDVTAYPLMFVENNTP